MRPKFSIMSPAFNRVALLGRAVQSSLSQAGLADYEIVVVDDFSSVGSSVLGFGDQVVTENFQIFHGKKVRWYTVVGKRTAGRVEEEPR